MIRFDRVIPDKRLPRSLTLVLVQRDANTSQDTIINAYEEQEQLQATFDVEQYRKHGGADHFHLARLVAVDEQAMRTTASSDTPWFTSPAPWLKLFSG